MNILKRLIYFILMPCCFAACKGSDKPAVEKNFQAELPQEQSAENKLLHYWDSYNFADTTALFNPNIGEQALVDFIAALQQASPAASAAAVNQMLSKAKPHDAAFRYFARQFEHYLYDANSPMRNEDVFEPVIAFMADSAAFSAAEKSRYQDLLRLLRKNKVGNAAADFAFELPNGAKSSLKAIDAPLTLLFFYEPGCQHCEAAIAELKGSARIQQLLKDQQLKIAAIYALGGRDIWKAYQTYIPGQWLNGFDAANRILNQKLYDLKASPTIYLLDEKKHVLLKDTSVSDVVSFFNSKI